MEENEIDFLSFIKVVKERTEEKKEEQEEIYEKYIKLFYSFKYFTYIEKGIIKEGQAVDISDDFKILLQLLVIKGILK